MRISDWSQTCALPISRIIVEPAARSTAPAIALAALALDPQSMLLVMPSDHAMTDVSAFLDAIAATAPTVEDGALALFGIAPARPETGYGYIAAGDLLADRTGVRTVRRFVEKPGLEKAADRKSQRLHSS